MSYVSSTALFHLRKEKKKYISFALKSPHIHTADGVNHVTSIDMGDEEMTSADQPMGQSPPQSVEVAPDHDA